VFQADVAKLRWPGRQWEDCGPGCRRAEGCPGGALYWAPSVASAVRRFEGTTYFSHSFNVLATEPAVTVSGIWELEGDRPRIVLQTRQFECAVLLAGSDSPFLFKIERRRDPFKLWPGLASLDDESVVWASPPLETGMASFDLVTGWGGVFAFADVGFTSTPGSAALAPIYGGSFVVRPASSGDQLVLGDWRTRTDGAVLGWTPAGGIQVLAEGPWLPAIVAASPERIAWLGVRGARAMEGSFDSAELYASPRAFDASGMRTQVIPAVPVAGMPHGFSTGGDFVSFGYCPGGCRILVGDLRSNKLWAIPSPTGKPLLVLGATETEVIAGEQRDDSEPLWFQTVYRYDLNRLAEYAEEL
jgi:hypothetical protein